MYAHFLQMTFRELHALPWHLISDKRELLLAYVIFSSMTPNVL